MLNNELSIWNDSIYGLAFKGREADLKSSARYISPESKVVIFALPSQQRGGVERVKNFLTDKGFNVADLCAVENTKSAIEEKFSAYGDDESVAIVLASDKYWAENRASFENYGGAWQLFSSMKIFYNVMKPSLKEAYALLEDDLSKEIFTEVLNVRFKIKSTRALLPYFDANQYFTLPEMITFDPDSVFVDCRAFVGDTVEKFIANCQSVFGKIYSFEPGKLQALAFLERRKRLMREWILDESQIQLIQAGLGDRATEGVLIYGPIWNGLGTLNVSYDEALLEKTTDKIKIVMLDDILQNERVDFIKADIEGSEMEMLQGAENIIKTQKPRLAISIYHKFTDYYEIPLYIKSLVPEYKMKVRHHSTDFYDTVLYCYI